MSVSLQRDQLLSDIDDPVTGILTEGTSHTFEVRRVREGFRASGSAAITIDLGSQLFGEIIEWKSLPVYPLASQILDMQDWERIHKVIRKLDALEGVFGMLNELTPEERESFEKTVKRRPLFE